jgi:restriction endonuclease Mrr
VEFPDFTELMRPLLLFLDSGQLEASEEIRAGLARQFGITAEQRADLLENGTPRWNNLVAWALHHLSRARLVERPRKAKAEYRITQRGRDAAASSAVIDVAFCQKFPEWHLTKWERRLAEGRPLSMPLLLIDLRN